MELDQLKIYTLSVDGSTCAVFRPSRPIVLDTFVYSAQRMGTATLSATVHDVECLDGLWTGREFVALDEGSLSGLPAIASSMERFFLLRTPSSSKSNEDARYVHTLEFVSERDVTLSNVYFCDAVRIDAATIDRYQSNNFDVVFFGTLSEFAGRFNDVLAYRGLDRRFSVVIDAAAILVNGSRYGFAGPSGGYYAWDDGGGFRFYSETTCPSVDDPLYVLEDGSYVLSGDTVEEVLMPEAEAVEVSFSRKTLFEALQAAYDAYKVPFWFRGDEIHFGEGSTLVPEVVFEYGHDEELLSIAKNNANADIVTRCTGIGGETNIPFYYPNPTPKGTLGVGGTAQGVTVVNQRLFAEKVSLTDTLTYAGNPYWSAVSAVSLGALPAAIGPITAIADGYEITPGATYRIPYTLAINVSIPSEGQWLRITPIFSNFKSTTTIDWSYASPTVRKYTSTQIVRQLEQDGLMMTVASAKIGDADVVFHEGTWKTVSRGTDASGSTIAPKAITTSWDFFFDGFQPGDYTLVVTGYILSSGPPRAMYYPRYIQGTITAVFDMAVDFQSDSDGHLGWVSSGGAFFDSLSEVGLAISGTPSVGDTITQVVLGKIRPSQNLMPPNYRASGGAERWYEALNDTYLLPDGSGYYAYANQYNPLSPREHIEEFPDIYPSIRHSNANYFDAVFFEAGYNTAETVVDKDGNERQKYTYFFAKLHPLGFNLFDCAIEGSDMTVEMLDGNCGACKFKILVGKDQKNHVQVDANGLVIADGRVVIDGPAIPAQNDTTSNSVWVCLGVDSSTYGSSPEAVMPGDTVRPVQGDHYVLTGIALPDAYFTMAEEALKHAILTFMAENNSEKFSYSINFSRVYLAHHHDVRDALSEHASLWLRYAGVSLPAPLHVRQFTCRQQEGEPLPEIDVELSDTIDAATGGLSRAIAASVRDIVNVVYQGGGYGGGMSQYASDRRYLRKDAPDTALEEITFAKGWRTDGYVAGLSGAALSVGSDGKTRLEIDSIYVRDGAIGAGTGGGESLLEIVEYEPASTAPGSGIRRTSAPRR